MNHVQYYYCGGTEQKPIKLCDARPFKGKDVDRVIWEWLVNLIKDPRAVMEGLQDSKNDAAQENKILIDRLGMIEGQIEGQDIQLSKLLDLYLSGDFPKDVLNERKARLEKNLANLRKEHQDLTATLEDIALTDRQVDEIQEYCDSIRDRLDTASFDEKRQLIDLFDVHGKLAIENEEKVIYITCLLTPQPVSLALTSHS